MAKLTTVLLMAALGNITCIAAGKTNGSHQGAPVASVKEANIKHWWQPETGERFWDIAILAHAFIDAEPSDRQDGIPTGKLSLNRSGIKQVVDFAKEIANGEHGEYDSLLIAHKGKLVFESYFRRGRIDLPHPQSSVTKVYTALALARVIELGYLTMADLGKPLISFLKEIVPTRLAKGADKITLHQALTMTTGISQTHSQWEAMQAYPKLITGQKEVQVLLEQSESVSAQTQVFNYGIGPQFVMQVVEAVTPMPVHEFIEKELFAKLGIVQYDWKTAANGLPESVWKSSLTARDMIKIGMLVMNEGKWNNQQLVSQAFINKATSRLLDTAEEEIFGGGKDVSQQGYGYYWWHSVLQHGDKRYTSVSAQGGGGIYIMLIKELDLIMVVTAHASENATQQLVAERVLPAFIN
ncbi:serine hydrolase [Pseudoalteromonas rubra]|uniref:Serine hydrolase n=1 Tax=Pseudoalteromonas rubra TaxID=43658 RepID=A0A4Q7EKM2_9GAMM|nr:serine hydrolase [Pseudoalteromonas rubra]RZM84698.1 serine hydrolase [Pseudoalteromonas rubra]